MVEIDASSSTVPLGVVPVTVAVFGTVVGSQSSPARVARLQR